MKQMPPKVPSFKPLHKMLTGAISSRLLLGGLNLKIFDVLEDWRTAEQTAAELGTNAGSTEYFMDALTNIGLLEKRGGRYRNMPMTNQYLSSASGYYVGDLFAMIRQMSIDPLEHLEDLVRKGPGPVQADIGPEPDDWWVKSARASMPWAVGEMGSRIAGIVKGLKGFSGFRRMLDLGGGHGVLSLYIAQTSEILEAVIFDHDPVTRLASEIISSWDMGERISVMAGDYTIDDFGDGYDLVFASATLNCAKHSLNTMISRIYNSLEPEGFFISLHDGMTNEHTEPALILEWLGGLLGAGRDVRFEQGELADAMLEAGFRTVRSRTLETPIGTMELDIAGK